MDAAEVIYRDEDGNTEKLSTGESLPGNPGLRISSVEIDEEGEWVMLEAIERSTGNDGSVMIPRDRVIRINEGPARQDA